MIVRLCRSSAKWKVCPFCSSFPVAALEKPSLARASSAASPGWSEEFRLWHRISLREAPGSARGTVGSQTAPASFLARIFTTVLPLRCPVLPGGGRPDAEKGKGRGSSSRKGVKRPRVSTWEASPPAVPCDGSQPSLGRACKVLKRGRSAGERIFHHTIREFTMWLTEASPFPIIVGIVFSGVRDFSKSLNW